MSMFEPAREPFPSRMLSLLRIIAGLIYTTSGTMILFGYPKSPVPMPPLVLLSQVGIGGLLEFIGGILIILGLFTRPTAFILAGEMAVAYFMQHYPKAFWPILNGGEPAVLYCFIFLYIASVGSGALSVDALIAKSRR